MFGEILEKFAENSPVTVMVRALLERILNPEKLDGWFELTRRKQYTRDILFSSLVGLILQVVCRNHPSVNAAYRRSDIAASIVSVYAKLKGIELLSIPTESGHRFRTKVATDSDAKWPPVPNQSGQRFRCPGHSGREARDAG